MSVGPCRPFSRRCIKNILISTVLIFFIVNVQFLLPDFKPANSSNKLPVQGNHGLPQSTGQPIRKIRTAPPPPAPPKDQKEKLDTGPVSNGSQGEDSRAAVHHIMNDSLNFIVNNINERQIIRNSNNNNFKLDPNGNILVFQVHNRDHYLKHVITSLKAIKGIDRTLVIFSHDFYSKEVFELIRNIDFCPVLQIFYPYAMQMFPNSFPGPSPKDCARNLKKTDAQKLGCINADHPDLYGHYREAPVVQTKHHWWWKLNRVFDGLSITQGFSGYVVFLEEDHYLSPDFLHFLDLMRKHQPGMCPHCSIISLGHYDKKPNFLRSDEVAEIRWLSSRHNMAMAFNRNVFNLLKNQSKFFCELDDYNWDWTLHFLSGSLSYPFHALVPIAPRAFHIGQCGVHHKGRCDPTGTLNPVVKLLDSAAPRLFPVKLKPGTATPLMRYVTSKKNKANGGWGDTRDHELCRSFVKKASPA